MAIYLGESFVIRQMRVFLRDRLTSSGRMVFYLTLLGNALGGISLAVKTYLVGVHLFCIALLSVFAARWARLRLKVGLEVAQRGTRGIPMQATLRVHNPHRRPARDIELRALTIPPHLSLICEGHSQEREEGIYIPLLAPDESARSSWTLIPNKRGAYLLTGVRQATLFPFGLWRDWHDHPIERSFLVYPSFTALETLDIPVGRRYQPGGIALSSNLGDSTEFISTREFRQGDSLRMIHWRSWARTGQAVVKEFQEEFFCRVAVVLDTFLSADQLDKRSQEFESVISLAAAIADFLAREEYVIDLFAAGPELYQLQAGRSLAHFENVMDILACVEPCTEPPFEKLEPVLLDSLENITTTVVVLLDWSEPRERLIQSIRDRGSGVRVILIGDQLSPERSAHLESMAGSFVWLTQSQLEQGVTAL